MRIRSVKASHAPENYKVDKPRDLDKLRDGVYHKLEQHDFGEINKLLRAANYPRYLHWEKLKYKTPPKDFGHKEWWYVVKMFRAFEANLTPIRAKDGEYFRFVRPMYTDKYLHEIDMYAGGQIVPSSAGFSSRRRQTLIARGILEEAIASSQLEGAHTTRKAAKEMILERKKPKNESEQMILNNYNTMLAIEESYKNQELSVEMLRELHRLLTEQTLEKRLQGRLRKDQDQIVVQGNIGAHEYVTHVPPNEKFVSSEIGRLVEYANNQGDEEYVHPIIKAINLHFWVGYLHPFVDGNGRLARALFYWYLLREGYWTLMYTPISTVIRKAPAQYAMAYIYSEQDDNDITYFYDFHMHKIMQALSELRRYLAERVDDNKQIEAMLKKKLQVNVRQRQLLYYMLSDELGSTTISSHRLINNVSRQTASKDLHALVAAGYLEVKSEGKGIRFVGTDGLKKLLK